MAAEDNNVPEQKPTSGNLRRNEDETGKPALSLKNCWRLSVDKSESLKFQGDPITGIPPQVCEFYLQ